MLYIFKAKSVFSVCHVQAKTHLAATQGTHKAVLGYHFQRDIRALEELLFQNPKIHSNDESNLSVAHPENHHNFSRKSNTQTLLKWAC